MSGNSVRLQTLGAVQTVRLSAQTPVQETAVEEEEVPEENLPEDTGETEQAPLAQPLYLSVQDSSASTSGLLGILSPRTGETGMVRCDSQDGSYTGTIVWNPQDSSFLPGVTYQANVTLYASEGYCFETDSISSTSGVLSGVSVSEDAGTVSFTVTFPETQALSGEEPSPEEEADPDGNTGEGNDGGMNPEEENSGKLRAQRTVRKITENRKTQTAAEKKTQARPQAEEGLLREEARSQVRQAVEQEVTQEEMQLPRQAAKKLQRKPQRAAPSTARILRLLLFQEMKRCFFP